MSTLISDRAARPDTVAARRLQISTADAGVAGLTARLAIAVACVAAVALIVLIALTSSPIADDYGDLATIGHAGVVPYLHGYWSTLTDRYANALLMVALIKPLGATAINVATPLLIALLFCFCLLATRAITAPGRGLYRRGLVAAAATITIATATPSLFDTLGWFNAVAIYLAGVVAAAGTVAWMARMAARSPRPGVPSIVISLLIGVLAAGFTELIGMVIALGALLAVATTRAQLPRGRRRRTLMACYLALAIGATGGVLVILRGPGSRSRFRFQHGGFDQTRILDAIHANLTWLSTFRWDALGAVAVGLLLFALRPTTIAPKVARWLVAWCVFLLCVPMLVVDVSTAYAGQTVAAPRTAYISVVFVAAALAAFAYLLAAALVSEHPRLRRAVTPLAALALLAAVGGFASAALPVIRAERLRQTAERERGASIRRQLAAQAQTITLTPAPLAIVDTSAFDLTFHHRGQYIYVLDGLREYYGIPAGTGLRIDPTQPAGYCLNGVNVPWAGVDSCQQLRAATSADVNGRS